MAFYPDEFSPIDRIRSLGKQTDSLADLGPLKNRRQWKSLVLGKKEMGMNNFATITEEKEEEMSSDGSQGANSNKGREEAPAAVLGVVTHKKITFPKPRKYITSRVSDRKEDASLRGVSCSVPFPSLASSAAGSSHADTDIKGTDLLGPVSSSKPGVSDTRQLLKAEKSKELISPAQDFIQNYALSETPIESQWNEAFSEGVGLTKWPKSNAEKMNPLKSESAHGLKPRQEEVKKASESSKPSVAPNTAVRRDLKGSKTKGSQQGRKLPKTKEELPSTSTSDKGKQKVEKGKALNMKEVVNVYKNLAYGSKEEIKSFVENLSFVKDEPKSESDKTLLSIMNLRALENKIKNFTKKSGKPPEASTSKAKKPKPEKFEKPVKRNRKAHIERLARHKVVKVPAVASNSHPNEAGKSKAVARAADQKEKKGSVKDKEPWKYVGMESVLDKTYFVYPAYPPSINLRNVTKTRKACAKKETTEVAAKKASVAEPKVKSPQVVAKPNLFTGGGSHGLSISGSGSSRSISRPSATTVCTVEFRPGVGRKIEESPAGAIDQSLLVYLHGTKAIHVKSPYSDKQFSRVKFFRKDERGMPLIKGLTRRAAPKGSQNVSVRNISFPEKLTRVRSLDLIDFDEDIQNITDFLRSQDSPHRQSQVESQRLKKSGREWPKESPEEPEAAASRHPRRQRHTVHQLHPHLEHLPLPHHHPPGSFQDILSPDLIMNEISKTMQHFQYLPDTEDNRKMIGQFFDELDQQIEASRKGALSFRKFPSPPDSGPFRPIPILGY